MAADDRDAVRGRQIMQIEIERIAGGRLGEAARRRGRRLGLVKGGERTSAAIADKHNLRAALVAQPLHSSGHVQQQGLVNCRDVVVGPPAGATDHRASSHSKGQDVIVAGLVGPRMHEMDARPRPSTPAAIEHAARWRAVSGDQVDRNRLERIRNIGPAEIGVLRILDAGTQIFRCHGFCATIEPRASTDRISDLPSLSPPDCAPG